MEDSFLYYIFANNFGWTPQQVDSAPDVLLRNMQIILDEVAKEEEREVKRRSKEHG